MFFVSILWAFQPQEADFVSNYQYRLYKSWLTKTDVSTQVAAGFSQEKVVKIFTYNDKQIIVEYIWENHKIIKQLQKLKINLKIRSDFTIDKYIHYAENLVYRLNSNDKQFAADFLNDEVLFRYNQKEGIAALDDFWNKYSKMVIAPDDIEIISSGEFGFRIPFFDDSFEIFFSTDIDLEKLSDELSIKESRISKTQEKVGIQPKEDTLLEKIKLKEKLQTDSVISKKNNITLITENHFDSDIYDLPIAEFIRKAHNVRQSKELLNNKIADVEAFLKQQFPQSKLQKIDELFYLKRGTFMEFNGDIFVQKEIKEDCINILPYYDYQLKNSKLVLPNKEEIDVSDLNMEEIDAIGNSILQLIYSHRALGTKLINFLIIHDEVPTTLIVRSDERELYEIYSYANLLLMLSKYWQNSQVYFNLNEVKKVNGKIELVGYLVANDDSGKYDMAEIWFRLDKDYKLDLIMMMLYQQLEIEN
jgi:hypothetical protein